MSMCSDVYIEKSEAKKRVKNMLMNDHEWLIDQFINKAKKHELASILNRDYDGVYYYHVTKDKKNPTPPEGMLETEMSNIGKGSDD